MQKLLRVFTSASLAASLVFGIASAVGASSGNISNTGPDSDNSIKQSLKVDSDVTNNNTATVGNEVMQFAHSSSAEVNHNTTGGDATSGDASNVSTVSTMYTVKNNTGPDADNLPLTGSNTGTIDKTGPDSDNKIEFKATVEADVTNNNDLSVTNSVMQTACTGSAEVEHNTTGGDATSGDASNSSIVNTTLSVTN